MTTHRLTLGDRWRRWSYLQDVEMWLSALPGSRRRSILRELHAGLQDASAERGMRAAIEDLGPARPLARGYLEVEPTDRPVWYQGAIAAMVVGGLWLFATAVYTFGMLDALLDAGADGATSSFLGLQIVADTSPGTLSAEFDGFSWPGLIAVVLAWFLGARAWRLARRRPR
jgi:hypothetical protein